MERTRQEVRSEAGGIEGCPAGGRRPRAAAVRVTPAVVLTVLSILVPSLAAAQTSGNDAAGSFDGLLRALDLKAKPAPEPAPEFVRKTRPATTAFVPVGRQHPERPDKIMTPAEVEAETNALDKDRLAQQRRAGIKPPPVPLKPAKPADPGRK